MNIKNLKLQLAEQGFRERWCDFQGDTKTFSPWSPHWKEAVCANREACFPYWDGHVNIHSQTTTPTVELNGRELNYFCTDCWEDDQKFDSKQLIALVKATMSHESPNQMMGIHCRAGVGRTGTFLAAYTLIRDIDEQIAHTTNVDQIQISIDRTVWQISLQRPFMVAHYSQYLTLYEVVNSYMAAISR